MESRLLELEPPTNHTHTQPHTHPTSTSPPSLNPLILHLPPSQIAGTILARELFLREKQETLFLLLFFPFPALFLLLLSLAFRGSSPADQPR